MSVLMKKRVAVRLLSLAVVVLAGCGGGGGSSATSTPAPTISASSTGGVFIEAQQVTLSSNGAPIYFTTDGTEPTAASERYRATLTLLTDTVLKAVAIDSSGRSSAILTLNFEIDIPPPTLASSSSGGVFNEIQVVTLTTSSGARIFFTLDGSEPSDSASEYDEPLTLETDVTLSAIAIDALDQTSEILRIAFEFDFDAPSSFSLDASTRVINVNNEGAFALSIVRGELASRYVVEIDDENVATSAVSLSGQITQSFSQELTADLSSLNDGDVSALLTLTDPVGNVSNPYRLELIKATSVSDARVGGLVSIASGTQIDLDVNESSVFNVSNNSFDTAQEIFAPGVLGGYVNQAFAGAEGNLLFTGDEDFFLISMMSGDNITLTIGENGADLDMELYNSNQALMADSLGTGNTESMTAPEDGDFYVRVFPFFGASNYVLSVGATGGASATNRSSQHMSSFDAFQPDHVVMQLNEKGDQAIGALHGSMSVVGGGPLDQPVLMAFHSVESRDAVIATASRNLHSKREVAAGAATQRAKQETIWAIKALGRQAGVASAEPNYWRQPLAVPNDTLYAEQWHYPQIQLPDAWDITTGSADVTVAVIDTGILSSHPDFAGQLVSGADLISDSVNAGDGDGVDTDPEDVGDQELGDGSSSFHGTHVAGTVAAATNNDIGVAGVAWNSRIMPVRVLGQFGGSTFDLIQSIRFAAGLSNATGTLPARAADVINMSLGGGAFSQSEADAVADARDAGVIVVAAAGNSGTNRLEYPASYDGVVSVSATNQTNALTGYSNYGAMIDVAAPGGDMGEDADSDGFPDGVLSAIGSDRDGAMTYGYRRYEGTSMAAPHVAGVAALMKSVYGALTPAEFDRLLVEGRITDDLGEEDRDDDFGYGLINANKAVIAAQQLANGTLEPLPPSLRSSPQRLSFGVTNSRQALTLTNAGGGDLTVSEVVGDVDWLSISASEVNESGLGAYLAVADRTTLAVGDFSANIRVTSSAGDLDIPVSIRIRSSDFAASAGVLFALLVNTDTRETVLQQRLSDISGDSYALNFEDVELGEYSLVVGSDMDNDGLICDAGEACGAFPTLNDEQEILITADAEFSLDVSFDQSRFFRSSLGNEASNQEPFEGYRYKEVVKVAQ